MASDKNACVGSDSLSWPRPFSQAPPSSLQVASDRVRNLSQGAAILSLARLGIDTLPEDLLESRSNTEVVHLIVLDLKQNILQLLPSELFMCLSSLQELDVSEVCGQSRARKKLQLLPIVFRSLLVKIVFSYFTSAHLN